MHTAIFIEYYQIADWNDSQ